MAENYVIRLEGGPLHGMELTCQDAGPVEEMKVGGAFGGGHYDYDRDEGGVRIWVVREGLQ